eukprot:g15298.t1
MTMRNPHRVSQLMRAKANTAKGDDTMCYKYTGNTPTELEGFKDVFCQHYTHLDLSTDDQDVANIAMVYLSDDFNDESAEVIENVKGKLNYTIDDACSSPLFSARDISLQRIL